MRQIKTAVVDFFRDLKKFADTDTFLPRAKRAALWTGVAAVGGPFLAVSALLGAFSGEFIGNGFGLVGAAVWIAAAVACVGVALLLQLAGVPIWLTALIAYFGVCLKFGLWMSQPDESDKK
jgi:hypothetical protein